MQYEWILDVLADLRAFARTNGLARLAERLDEAARAAEEEIARPGTGPASVRAEGNEAP